MSMRILATGTVALLGLIAATDVSAATGEDRWLPFQGCWRAENAPASNLLCIVADGAGVRMIELADGAIARETRITADGQPRAITQEGCSGTEKARWSADGRRLYLDTELTCGDQFKRNTTGVFSMISPREWVSIQAIAVDNEAATRTVKYDAVESLAPEATSLPGQSRTAMEGIFSQLRANRLARETARYIAARPLTLDEVREASKEVHPRAVEALLIARKQQFALDGKKLLALADAGVPKYVIDAIVAVSHPEMFEVKDRPAQGTGQERDRNAYAGGRYCDSWDDWYDPWCRNYGYNRYSPFGYYGFNNYNYGRGNYYGPGYYGTPIIVVRGPETTVNRGKASPRGYTRGTSVSGSSSGASRSSGSSSASGSSSSGGSSSSSGAATTSSAGSSSTVTGKAKPRGGGQ